MKVQFANLVNGFSPKYEQLKAEQTLEQQQMQNQHQQHISNQYGLPQ